MRAFSLIFLFVLAVACSSTETNGHERPVDSTFFQAQVKVQSMPKVDLLFAIDDSPSMADKQAILPDQLAAVVQRFLAPRCIAEELPACATNADCAALGANATCDTLGYINVCVAPSDLGVCPSGARAEFPAIHDLHVGIVRSCSPGRLFGGTLANAQPMSGVGGGFLAWLPRNLPQNVNKPAPNVTAYDDAGAFISDFRSLVSQVGANGCGIESQLESWYQLLVEPFPDGTTLAMRRDFLRPDTFVMIVQITDEDDASIDPTSPSAVFMKNVPLGPRATSACDKDPSSPACSSCAYPENASDPSCAKQSWYLPGQDSLDVRFTDVTKQRYGLDPLFDVHRYIDGLRNWKLGDTPNPLFVPYRTPDMVMYALVAGVAPSLLLDANGNFKIEPSPDDWAKLTGSPRDPHMIESIAPRVGASGDWNTTNAQGIGDMGTSVDLQFACTFDLPKPRDCTIESPCDCAPGSSAPLCDPNAPTMQTRGKAYPSIRELRVAQGLYSQATVGSICAPFMPAFIGFFDRLRDGGDRQCFPESLPVAADRTVSCQMLVEYPAQTDQSAGCTDPGTSQPDSGTLAWFQRRFLAALGDAGGQPVPVLCVYRQLTTNDYSGPTCETSPNAGWCYVVGAANTGGCPSDFEFGADGPPPGTTLTLSCVR